MAAILRYSAPTFTVGAMTDAHSDFLASMKQARTRAHLFGTFSVAVLLVGAVLVADLGRTLSVVGAAMGAWILVQLVGILYLRTQPKSAAVGIAIVGGVATVLAVLGVTVVSDGWREAILVAGVWFAFATGAEFVRGEQWAKALKTEGSQGDIVRTLAVYAGYDGTPLVSFLSGGVLVGVWAWLLDVLPWLTPFAMLVHCAVALGLSANPRTRSAD